jgi:hypothetical protein
MIDDALWERLVGRIVADEAIERPLAERIMDQALGFLKLCSLDRGASYSPSPLVDIGWHTFILYTRPYAAFCEKLGGFTHHDPTDVEGVDYGSGHVNRTMDAMIAFGLVADEPLWANTGHDCDSGGSCGSCAGGACTT